MLISKSLVFENEKCKFYKTDMTESLTRYAIKEDFKDRVLKNCLILLAEIKETEQLRYVVLINNEIVEDSMTFEGVACIIDKLKLLYGEKYYK